MPITYEVEKDYLYKKGRQEGKRANQLKTAKKLLASTSLTPKQIANATDLSVADVEELKKQM